MHGGETYTLTVVYNGVTYVAAEQTPDANPIDTIASYYLPDNNGFITKGYYVFIQGVEASPEPGDYYLFKAYRNDTLKDDFGPLLDDDQFGSVSYLNQNFDIFNIVQELALGKTPRPFPFVVEPTDTIRVEQYAVNQKYYQFYYRFYLSITSLRNHWSQVCTFFHLCPQWEAVV